MKPSISHAYAFLAAINVTYVCYKFILSFSEDSTFQSLSPPGEGREGFFAGPDSGSEGRQSAAAGGISKRLGQAEEIHRVGFQHHRHELTLWPSGAILQHSKRNMITHSESLNDSPPDSHI